MISDHLLAAREAVRRRTWISAQCDSCLLQASRHDNDEWRVVVVDDHGATGYTLSGRELARKIGEVLDKGGEIL